MANQLKIIKRIQIKVRGSELRSAREQAGLCREQVNRAMHKWHWHVNSCTRKERSETFEIGAEELRDLCIVLRVSPALYPEDDHLQ